MEILLENERAWSSNKRGKRMSHRIASQDVVGWSARNTLEKRGRMGYALEGISKGRHQTPKICFGTKNDVFFSPQNEATSPLVRKGLLQRECTRRLIHKSGNLPPLKIKKMRLLT